VSVSELIKKIEEIIERLGDLRIGWKNVDDYPSPVNIILKKEEPEGKMWVELTEFPSKTQQQIVEDLSKGNNFTQPSNIKHMLATEFIEKLKEIVGEENKLEIEVTPDTIGEERYLNRKTGDVLHIPRFWDR